MAQPRADRMFRAFADETRLRILRLLTRGELCVCDIQAALGAPQSKVSRHLATLRRAGLVTDRRQGLWKHYKLAEPSGPLQTRLLACLGPCLDEVGMLIRDARRLARLKARRKACP